MKLKHITIPEGTSVSSAVTIKSENGFEAEVALIRYLEEDKIEVRKWWHVCRCDEDFDYSVPYYGGMKYQAMDRYIDAVRECSIFTL